MTWPLKTRNKIWKSHITHLWSVEQECAGTDELMLAYIFLHGCLVLFDQFLYLSRKTISLSLQLLVQLQSVLIHFSLELVLQGHQVLLVLPPHALIARHLLSQLRVLFVFLHLPSYLESKDLVSHTQYKYPILSVLVFSCSYNQEAPHYIIIKSYALLRGIQKPLPA